MRNAGLEETQTGIKIDGKNFNNSDMQMIPPLWQKVKKNYEPLEESKKKKRRAKNLAQNSTFRKLRSGHLVPSPQANRWGNNGNCDRPYFWGLQNFCRW